MEESGDRFGRELEHLRRQARWHRRIGITALTLVAAAFVMGQAVPPGLVDEIRAKRLLLVDDEGGTRGALALGPDGSVLFILADGSRKPRTVLSVGPDGAPSLAVYDAEGRRRAALGVDRDGVPALTLTDRDGARPAVAMSVAQEGSARLVFSDAGQRHRLVVGMSDGDPTLILTGEEGKRGVALAVDAESPRLALADRNGTERLWVAIRRDSPVLQFFDDTRVARTGLTTMNADTGIAVLSEASGSTPGLVLYDKDRKVAWSAP